MRGFNRPPFALLKKTGGLWCSEERSSLESVIVCLLAASLLEILGDAISYIVSLLPAGDGLWRRRTGHPGVLIRYIMRALG